MSLKVTITRTVEIEHCWRECPHFTSDGNVMVCGHPNAPDQGYIISHPLCLTGFPEKCPLLPANVANWPSHEKPKA